MAVTVNHAFVSALPDDPADLAAGKVCQQAHWNAAHTVVGAVDKAGDTMTGTLTSTLGTITADTPNWTGTATWNNAGVTFTGIKYNVTDTASNASSLVADLQLNGSTVLGVRKDRIVYSNPSDSDLFSGRAIWNSYTRVSDGILTIGSSGNNSMLFEFAAQNKVVMLNAALFGWSSTGVDTCANLRSGLDTAFYRNAAGVVEVNNGTAGTFRDLITRYVATSPTTVASLPAAAAGNKGFRGFVTDATQTMTAGIGAVVAGTGANNVPVYSDGTNWRIG
jgi:hypothetical protein